VKDSRNEFYKVAEQVVQGSYVFGELERGTQQVLLRSTLDAGTLVLVVAHHRVHGPLLFSGFYIPKIGSGTFGVRVAFSGDKVSWRPAMASDLTLADYCAKATEPPALRTDGQLAIEALKHFVCSPAEARSPRAPQAPVDAARSAVE